MSKRIPIAAGLRPRETPLRRLDARARLPAANHWLRALPWLLVLLAPGRLPAWDPDAGLVMSYARGAPVATTSGTNPANVTDGNDNTHWQSGACFPTGYIARPELNTLLGVCAAGGCESPSVRGIAGATDNSPYTGAAVSPVDGLASFEVRLPAPRPLHAIGLRGIFSKPTVLEAIGPDGAATVAAFDSPDNYGYRRYAAPPGDILALRVTSIAAFTLTEIATLVEPCFEQASVDLGTERTLGWIATRHWAGGKALSSRLLASRDGQTWTTVATLDPNALRPVVTLPADPIRARYLAVRHQVVEADWAKVYCWEIRAFDTDGPYGPAPAPRISSAPLADMLGVNGIWGWGNGKYSDSIVPGQGPDLYRAFSGHARNYHNLSWDVTDPDHIPDYAAMAAGEGTEAQWWLSWDREYGAWVAAGLEVEASLQFGNATFPTGVWDDPPTASYNIGYAFAEHFGPSFGTGDIGWLEIGNEPWDYPAAFYREVLLGMVQGAKGADPALKLMPAALQADTPEAAEASGGNYLGARVPAEAAPYLDAINTHVYSFATDASGLRTGVRPEQRASSMHSLRNVLRWRDANLPGVPVFVTEWGWDSDGAGETCSASECVSERAQAVYAVRGLLTMARAGAQRMTWYFYANLPNTPTLFGRSGVTGSALVGFAPKASYYALSALINTLGDRHFVGTVQEDDQAYVYLLGDAQGQPTHVVAWRPVDGDDAGETTITFPLSGNPGDAWVLSGASAWGEPTPRPTAAGGAWTMTVSSAPTAAAIEN